MTRGEPSVGRCCPSPGKSAKPYLSALTLEAVEPLCLCPRAWQSAGEQPRVSAGPVSTPGISWGSLAEQPGGGAVRLPNRGAPCRPTASSLLGGDPHQSHPTFVLRFDSASRPLGLTKAIHEPKRFLLFVGGVDHEGEYKRSAC